MTIPVREKDLYFYASVKTDHAQVRANENEILMCNMKQ